MPNTVKVVDEDGREHWTAVGSPLHQRLTAPKPEEVATSASDDAPQGDGDDTAAVDSGSGDGEAGDTATARRGRRASKAEPDADREQ